MLLLEKNVFGVAAKEDVLWKTLKMKKKGTKRRKWTSGVNESL
jgi:hypothetical protein